LVLEIAIFVVSAVVHDDHDFLGQLRQALAFVN
jgi:hypothetical protein